MGIYYNADATNVISFRNPGLIDPLAISTLGVSVKESDSPIGMFGTGLKYAIAIVLRLGGEIVVHRGLEPLRFGVESAKIRDVDFRILTMNGERLAFTTELGKHWEPWMAFRELACNAWDEGGEIVPGPLDPTPGTTTIVVRCEEIAEIYPEVDLYFSRHRTPAYSSPTVAFHAHKADAIFYRGVRVSGSDSGRKFMFPPELVAKQRLTEDRTLHSRWEANYAIAQAIVERCDDPAFLRSWLTTGEHYSEHFIDLDHQTLFPSETFTDVMRDLVLDANVVLNSTARQKYRHHAGNPDDTIPRIPESDLMSSERIALRRAIELSRAVGFPVDEFEFYIVESLGHKGLLGRADREKRVYYFTRHNLSLGHLAVASVMIEEWAHIRHGFDDCTTQMQSWLFENLTRVADAYIVERDLVRQITGKVPQ